MRPIVTAGQRSDVTQALALLDGHEGAAVIGDKPYDSNALRALIAGMGVEAVILPTRKIAFPHAPIVRGQRNRVERCFNRGKRFDASPPDTTQEPSTSLASLNSRMS